MQLGRRSSCWSPGCVFLWQRARMGAITNDDVTGTVFACMHFKQINIQVNRSVNQYQKRKRKRFDSVL